MKIKSIKIEKLFEVFDYDIQYTNDENILIITGPNGFGKTQILNIIYHLFNGKFYFFLMLEFHKITLAFDDENIRIEMLKSTRKGKEDVVLVFYDDEKDPERFFVSDNSILDYIPVSIIILQTHRDKWYIPDIKKTLSTKEVLRKYENQLSGKIPIDNRRIQNILDKIQAYLIKEQRLFKRIQILDNEAEHVKIEETIDTFAQELQILIGLFTKKSYELSQDLDSSYPTRLISEKEKLSKEEYDKRFNEVKKKQDLLTKHGLYDGKQQPLEYSEEDAKALLVYLKDLEKKLEVYDDLIERLELFTTILNERRFLFKSIYIDKEKGFYFKTDRNKLLELHQLSSGEQHEVILLYELIFNTNADMIVLIDEPEISLHVTWQKEFIKDLIKIIELQKFQVLIATHAPSIINGRWDLVYNLDKKVVHETE